MSKSERISSEKDPFDGETLRRLIEESEQAKELTVCVMALRDIERGEINSAVSRLMVDLDKLLMIAPELYSYLLAHKQG